MCEDEHNVVMYANDKQYSDFLANTDNQEITNFHPGVE